MVQYRRNRVSGGTYFFTVNIKNRQSCLLTTYLDLLRAAFRIVRHKQPFQIIAIVILPEHLHTVWTLPVGDDNYSARWRAVKDWPASSFHRYVRLGLLNESWGSVVVDEPEISFGE